MLETFVDNPPASQNANYVSILAQAVISSVWLSPRPPAETNVLTRKATPRRHHQKVVTWVITAFSLGWGCMGLVTPVIGASDTVRPDFPTFNLQVTPCWGPDYSGSGE